MKTKYTPGPWRLCELINGAYAVYGKGEYDIIFPHLTAGIDTNARLIKAAPEMLEALKVIRDAYGRTDNSKDYMLALAMKNAIDIIKELEADHA